MGNPINRTGAPNGIQNSPVSVKPGRTQKPSSGPQFADVMANIPNPAMKKSLTGALKYLQGILPRIKDPKLAKDTTGLINEVKGLLAKPGVTLDEVLAVDDRIDDIHDRYRAEIRPSQEYIKSYVKPAVIVAREAAQRE